MKPLITHGTFQPLFIFLVLYTTFGTGLDLMKVEALGGHKPQDCHLFYTAAYGKAIGWPQYDKIPTYIHHAIPKRYLSPYSLPKTWIFLNLFLVPTAKWHEISFYIL